MKVVIAGGPRCGKTTYADELGGTVLHTDDLISTHDWSEASDEVALWLNREGSWTIEGVATVRALRKWLKSHPSGKPCDRLVWMAAPKQELSRGQHSMLIGCTKVFAEVRAELVKRGVAVEFRS